MSHAVQSYPYAWSVLQSSSALLRRLCAVRHSRRIKNQNGTVHHRQFHLQAMQHKPAPLLHRTLACTPQHHSHNGVMHAWVTFLMTRVPLASEKASHLPQTTPQTT